MSAWQKLRAAFDARNRRERIVLALLAAVVVTLLWAELAWDGQRQAARRLQQERATLETRLTANADLERQRRQLEAHMAELDRRLKSQMGDLIDPANMARVLEAILTRHTDLRLRRLENLPTRPLLAGEDGKAPEAGVYRHGLALELLLGRPGAGGGGLPACGDHHSRAYPEPGRGLDRCIGESSSCCWPVLRASRRPRCWTIPPGHPATG